VRAFFTSLIAFFLALLAGGLVAQQMAVLTRAGEEYILVFIAVVLMAIVFAIVFLFAQFGGRPAVDATGKWSLIVMAVLLLVLIGGDYWAVGGNAARLAADLPIIGGFALPALVIILVNWLFVRWRLRASAAFGRGGQTK
jgi:hypothetical protein